MSGSSGPTGLRGQEAERPRVPASRVDRRVSVWWRGAGMSPQSPPCPPQQLVPASLGWLWLLPCAPPSLPVVSRGGPWKGHVLLASSP